MICPNCSSNVEEGSTFCPYCGVHLSVAAPVSYSGGMVDAGAYYDEEATLPFMPDISEIPSTEFCLKCGRTLVRGQMCSCEGVAPASTSFGSDATYRTSEPISSMSGPAMTTTSVPKTSTPASSPSGTSSAGKSFFKSVNKL